MRYKGMKGVCWELLRQLVFNKYGRDCYTCDRKNLEGRNLQAGHYQTVAVVGSNNKLSWDHKQIRPQCFYCNGIGQGEQAKFRQHLIQELGEAAVLELEKRRYKIDPIKNWVVFKDTLQEELDYLVVHR